MAYLHRFHINQPLKEILMCFNRYFHPVMLEKTLG